MKLSLRKNLFATREGWAAFPCIANDWKGVGAGKGSTQACRFSVSIE